MAQSTVSVRVPKALKAKLRRHGVSVSEVTREALEREARRRDEQEFEEKRRKLALRTQGKVSVKEIVEIIRETREER